MKSLVAAQFIACILALLVCLFAPLPGRPVLLVPFGSANASAALHMPADGLRLLGTGRIRGSLIARADGQLPVGQLLMLGILPIAVPSFLCGQPQSLAQTNDKDS